MFSLRGTLRLELVSTLLVALIFVHAALISSKEADDDMWVSQQDRSDWVDPHDMINYDPVKKTNRRSTKNMVAPPIDNDNNNDIPDTASSSSSQSPPNSIPSPPSFSSSPLSSSSSPKSEFVENDSAPDGNTLRTTLEDCTSNLEKAISNLEKAMASLERCENQTRTTVIPKDHLFFKRFLRQQLAYFSAFLDPSLTGHYDVEVKLSSSQYTYLREFAQLESSSGSVQEVHDILANMFNNIRWHEANESYKQPWSEFVREHIDIAFKFVLILSSALWSVSLISRMRVQSFWWFMLRLSVLAILLSVPWTWYHLYKKKVAAQRAQLMKEGMSEECRQRHESVGARIWSTWFGTSRDCERYYEHLEIDPLWEVTPAEAVAVTITRFFVEPAGNVGDAISTLMKRAFDGLPFYHYLFVYGILFLVPILVLFVLSGYRLRTLLFNIEPANEGNQRLALENEVSKRDAEIKKLSQMLSETREELSHTMERSRQISLDYELAQRDIRDLNLRQLQFTSNPHSALAIANIDSSEIESTPLQDTRLIRPLKTQPGSNLQTNSLRDGGGGDFVESQDDSKSKPGVDGQLNSGVASGGEDLNIISNELGTMVGTAAIGEAGDAQRCRVVNEGGEVMEGGKEGVEHPGSDLDFEVV